jgi:hypothetical protein
MELYILILIYVHYICIKDDPSTYSFYIEDDIFKLIA